MVGFALTGFVSTSYVITFVQKIIKSHEKVIKNPIVILGILMQY